MGENELKQKSRRQRDGPGVGEEGGLMLDESLLTGPKDMQFIPYFCLHTVRFKYVVNKPVLSLVNLRLARLRLGFHFGNQRFLVRCN